MEDKNSMFELHFGALCHPLTRQFKDQGIRMNVGIRSSVAIWQKDADAITRLAIRQLLPDTAVRNARQKLLKKIIRGIAANGQATATSEASHSQIVIPQDKVESGWQPIETAPKDGTKILLARGDHVWLDEWWKGDGTNSDWADLAAWQQSTGKIPKQPTKWMPIPSTQATGGLPSQHVPDYGQASLPDESCSPTPTSKLTDAEFYARGLARSRYHDKLFAASQPRPSNDQFDEGWDAARKFYSPTPTEGEGARAVVGTVFDNTAASHETLKRVMIERITAHSATLTRERDSLREALGGIGCQVIHASYPKGATCLDIEGYARKNKVPYKFERAFRAKILAGEERCIGCKIRAALATPEENQDGKR